MSPASSLIVEADVVGFAEGSSEVSQWPGTELPPGSKSGACTYEGRPGTWETLLSPRIEPGGMPADQAPGPGRRASLAWE